MGHVLYTWGPVDEARRITLPEAMPPEIRDVKAAIERCTCPADIRRVVEAITETATLTGGTLTVSGVDTPPREGMTWGPITRLSPDTADIGQVQARVRKAVVNYETVDVTETLSGYSVPIPEAYTDLVAVDEQHQDISCRLYIWPGTADVGVPWHPGQPDVYLFDAPVADPPAVWFNPAYLTEDARRYIKPADLDAWERARE